MTTSIPTFTVLHDPKQQAGHRFLVLNAEEDIVLRCSTRKAAEFAASITLPDIQSQTNSPTQENSIMSSTTESTYTEGVDPVTESLLADPAAHAQRLIDDAAESSMLPEGLPDELAADYRLQCEVIDTIEARKIPMQVPMFLNGVDEDGLPTVFGEGCIAASANVMIGNEKVAVSSLVNKLSAQDLVKAACAPFASHLLKRFKLETGTVKAANTYINIPKVETTIDGDRAEVWQNAVIGLHYDGYDVPGVLLFVVRLHENSPKREEGYEGFMAVLYDPDTFAGDGGTKVADWGWSDPSCWQRGGISMYLDAEQMDQRLRMFGRYLQARRLTRSYDKIARLAVEAGRRQPEHEEEQDFVVTRTPMRKSKAAAADPF